MRGGFALSEQHDKWLRLAIVAGLLLWNTLEGAKFENEYPKGFIRLYPYPLWRLALLAALVLGAMWCPSVGMMMAFAIFFYYLDMEVTLDKWVV